MLVRRVVISTEFSLDWLARKPYRDFDAQLLRALARLSSWPTPEQYDELARATPRAVDVHLPRFVTEQRDAVRRAGGYERHVARFLAVPTRAQHWHDFFNMVVWAQFPKLRWALNALHVDESIGPKDPRNRRAPAQNLAATLDESGLLVVSSSLSVLNDLRALRFRHAFWERREEVLATTRFCVVGHGLLEALLVPRPGLSARGLLMHVPDWRVFSSEEQLRYALDAAAAQQVARFREARAVLDPVPVLTIPHFAENDCRSFYDDHRNIRFVPSSRLPAEERTSFWSLETGGADASRTPVSQSATDLKP